MADALAPRQRIAAYGLCVEDGAVLLTRAGKGSGSPGTWFLPGGGVEHGEDPRDAVRREVAEETGLDVLVRDEPVVVSDVGDLPREGVRLHTVRIVYPVVVAGGVLADEVDGSTDHAAWVPLEQARALAAVAPFTAWILAGAAAAGGAR